MSEYDGDAISSSEWNEAERRDIEEKLDSKKTKSNQVIAYKDVEVIMPEVKIKEVYFERIFNLGNYENFKIGLTASVGPGDTAEDVVIALDKFTLKMRNEHVRGGK